MLDTETKRRIDTARNILVGKVPDPKSQVEQITIALIYKFMDDMDAQSVEMGGKASFFTGEFEKYGWRRVFDPRLGGFDILALYSEAITKINENANVPQLFRDIFKNAYLPYRDPETLKLFLKTIDEFRYDHSERLGDAFEYLLSVLGSQGDAGQFRTPRHIIDFIVDIVDPQKGETILDPASGTAGFLISAYKHIVANNPDMTPDERKRLMTNVVGYDISPDMVRLGLANMYLHGFPTPEIHEYDTLTSEDRWNEYFDVILANPPFMSPKGGIQPHKKFAISAKRSEVLFVDYIAEHLTTKGRAGIIVPEGIIFQSQTAYKALRKMLVEQYLVAVVSLPAGVFNPYSGVKTSILILDRALAKQSDTVGFFKVENDGFGLGAQRRPIDKNDLPQVLAEIEEYLRRLRANESVAAEDFSPTRGLIVAKERIAANGDFNLGGERYRDGAAKSVTYPSYPLSELCDILNGSTPAKGEPRYWQAGTVPWFTIDDMREQGRIITRTQQFVTDAALAETSIKLLPEQSVLLCCTASVGEYAFAQIALTTNQQFNGLVVKDSVRDRLLPSFLFVIASRFKEELIRLSGKTAFNYVSVGTLKTIEIPLPALEVQKEIVAEIEGYQKVIDGARAVLDHYRPHIPINPDWPMVRLEDACEIQRGKFTHRPRNEPRFYGGVYPFIQTGDVVRASETGGKVTYTQTLNEEGLSVSRLFQPPIVLITIAANIGDTAVLDFPCAFPDSVVGLIPKDGVDVHFLELTMRTKKERLNELAPQAAQKNINNEILKELEIPLPPLAEQAKIVAEIEAEQRLVEANRQLIERMEQKIAAVLDRIWGTETAESQPTTQTDAAMG